MRQSVNLRQMCYYFFTVVVAAAIFIYLFSHVSLSEIANLLKRIDGGMFSFFVVISLTGAVFRTWRYRLLLLTTGESAGFSALYLVTLVRNLFSDLLPARIGSLVYVYIVNTRLGIPFGAAASSFALSLIFDIIALAVLVIIIALITSTAIIPPAMIVSSGIVLGVLSVIILYKLPIIFRFIGKAIEGFTLISAVPRAGLCNALNSAATGVKQAYEAGVYFQILLISLCVRLCKYISLYILLLALVHQFDMGIEQFPFSKVFFGLCTAEISASLPISGIAGFGVYEGAWALVFQLLGYSKKIAILTSISHHLVTQIFGYSIGAIALLLLVLPYFNYDNRSIGKSRGHKNKSGDASSSDLSKSLWRGRVGFFAVLQIVSLSLFTIPSSVKGYGSPTLKEHIRSTTPGNDIRDKNNDLVKVLIKNKAKVVYQCNNGICKKLIGDKRPIQLTNNGTYPRWSPDGLWIAFVRGNAIMRMTSNGKELQVLAEAKAPRSVAWTYDGRVIFTDGRVIKVVHPENLSVETLISGSKFFEIDMVPSSKGDILAATVKANFSYNVKIFNLKTGKRRTIAQGCSASLSPDGQLVSVAASSHKQLNLFSVHSGEKRGHINAPPQFKFDNQYWASRQNWIVSKSEGVQANIFVHHVLTNRVWQVTFTNDCDRPDLYIASD